MRTETEYLDNNLIDIGNHTLIKPLFYADWLDWLKSNKEVADMKFSDMNPKTPNVVSVIPKGSSITVEVVNVKDVNTKFGMKTVATVMYKSKEYAFWINNTSAKKFVDKGMKSTEELMNKKIALKKIEALIQGKETEVVVAV